MFVNRRYIPETDIIAVGARCIARLRQWGCVLRRVVGVLIIVASISMAAFTPVSAEIRPLDGTGRIGKEVRLPLVLGDTTSYRVGDTVRVSGLFELEQPTVFYPQIFRPLGGDMLQETTLVPESRTTWRYAFSLRVTRDLGPGDTLLLLVGEALAGSDTVSAITFSGMLVEGMPQQTRVVAIRTETVGNILPYVRFGQLDPGRPNPTVPGGRVTWGFTIDDESEVIFRIYDLTGRMVVEDDLGRLPKGIYTHSITPTLATPSGFFIVHLETEIGHDYEVMHVLH